MTKLTRIVPFALLVTVALGLAGAAPAAAQGLAEIHMSPERQQCVDLIKNDAEFKAYIDDRARYAFHRDETSKLTRNNEHVVMAYAAIWVLTVGFLVAVFLRQLGLKKELARLREELVRAEKGA